MADTSAKPSLTHTAFAFKREGRRFNSGRWVEVGTGRIDERGIAVLYLDRLPIGGFSGAIQLAPYGETPLPPQSKPLRPGEGGEAEDDTED